MKKIIVGALAVAALIVGCKSIEFEKVERTPIVVGTNCVAITERVVRGEYYAYGLENNLEGLEIAAQTNGVAVKINRVSYDMSSQHAAIVDKSLSGAANLAAKIGAAIATSGVSVGANSVAGFVQKFVEKGGDASKASVTITDGKLTCTDGTCSAVMDCVDCGE